jgi:hypothetical protein
MSDDDMGKRNPTGFGIRLAHNVYLDFKNANDALDDDIMRKPALIGIYVRLASPDRANAELLVKMAATTKVWTVNVVSKGTIKKGEEIVVGDASMHYNAKQRVESPIKNAIPASAGDMANLERQSQPTASRAVILKAFKALPALKSNSCHLDSFIGAVYASMFHNSHLFDDTIVISDTLTFNKSTGKPNMDITDVEKQRYMLLRDLVLAISEGSTNESAVNRVRDFMRLGLLGAKNTTKLGSVGDWVLQFEKLFETTYVSSGICTHDTPSHHDGRAVQTVSRRLLAFSTNNESDLDPFRVVQNQMSLGDIQPTCVIADENVKICNRPLENAVLYIQGLPRIIVLNAFYDSANGHRRFSIPVVNEKDFYDFEIEYPVKLTSEGVAGKSSAKYRLTGIAFFNASHWKVYLNIATRWVLYDDTMQVNPNIVYEAMSGSVLFFTRID